MNKKETPGPILNETKGEIIKKPAKNNKKNQTNILKMKDLMNFLKFMYMHIYYVQLYFMYFIYMKKKKKAVKSARRAWKIYNYSFTNCQEISDCVFLEREKYSAFQVPEVQLVKKRFLFSRKWIIIYMAFTKRTLKKLSYHFFENSIIWKP